MKRWLPLCLCAGLGLPAAAQDMDDALGGFDALPVIKLSEEPVPELSGPRAWQLSGSLIGTTTYNLRAHESSTGTDYGGFSRLRLRAGLGLDARLGDDWQLSLNGYLAEDVIYRLRDQDYTDEVLRDFQTDAQLQDSFIRGRLGSRWDLKLGRQVAAWGFADSLRVLDVLNPLDSREPGLADIEDLRLARGMLRLDHYRGPWQLGLYLLPEQRFSRLPPFGSDFYPLMDSQGNAVRVRRERPEHFKSLSWAGSATGRFSGWDLSLHAARLWRDEPYLDGSAFTADDPDATEADFFEDAVLRHSRINMLGLGTQFTRGSWLFKQEAALLTDVMLTAAQDIEAGLLNNLPLIGGLLPGQGETARVPNALSSHDLYQGLIGVEYYGLVDTSISLELAARQFSDFGPDQADAGAVHRRTETALRITREFLRARLRATLVSVLIDQDWRFGQSGGGAIHRLSAAYELGPGLALEGTLIAYESGNQPGFASIGRNDRLNVEIRWSF